MPLSKRSFLRFAGTAAAGWAVAQSANAQASATAPAAAPAGPPKAPARPTADEAIKLLAEGNARFVSGKGSYSCRTPQDFSALAAAQYPFAVIVACADSRVGPEVMFDRGLGDLFVVRVAGNVVAGTGDPLKGSIEYGVAVLGAPLVVVLGHTQCGAVKAAIEQVEKPSKLPGAIAGLVDLVKPAVLDVKGKPGDKLENATVVNVQRQLKRLRDLDPIIAPGVKKGTVKVVGGVFDLASGKVTMVA